MDEKKEKRLSNEKFKQLNRRDRRKLMKANGMFKRTRRK